MRRPLELRTTRTGFPARQFLDSAPSLSFRGASQFKASALKGSGKTELSLLQVRITRNDGLMVEKSLFQYRNKDLFTN